MVNGPPLDGYAFADRKVAMVSHEGAHPLLEDGKVHEGTLLFFFFVGVSPVLPSAVPFVPGKPRPPPNGELAARASWPRRVVGRTGRLESVSAVVYGDGGAESSRVDASRRFEMCL